MFLPGPWTPFIAAIIGLVFGVGGGLIRPFEDGSPKVKALGASAMTLTVLSETLQNLWVTIFYGIPLTASIMSGIPSLMTALVNNTLLMATAGPRVITAIRNQR